MFVSVKIVWVAVCTRILSMVSVLTCDVKLVLGSFKLGACAPLTLLDWSGVAVVCVSVFPSLFVVRSQLSFS